MADNKKKETVSEKPLGKKEDKMTEKVSENKKTTGSKKPAAQKAQDGKKDEGKNPFSGMKRRTKQRIISIASICLVIVGAVLLNIIAGALTDRYNSLTADITQKGSFNISETMIKLASGIKKNVTITFLEDKADYEAMDSYCKQATSIADQLSRQSGGRISVEYTDLVKNPTFQSKYPDESLQATDVIVSSGEDKYNVLHKEDMYQFAAYGDQYYISASKAESALGTAIVNVTSDRNDKIAVITNNCGDDPSYLEKVLKSNNYAVDETDIEEGNIAGSANTVIAFTPKKDYSKEAVTKIKKFLENDGKYGKSMIFIAYRGDVESPNIDSLLKDYGMQVREGLAFDADTSRMINGNAYKDIVALFTSNLYTDNIGENDPAVIVGYSRAVVSLNDNAVPLLSLSDKSGTCPYDAEQGKWNMDDAITGDTHILMQGLTGTDESFSRVIYSGSSLMWSESYMQSPYSNQTYALNIIDTLNHREDNSVRLEDKVITEYDLTLDSRTKSMIGFVMYALLPLLIVGAGFTVFLVRRRK